MNHRTSGALGARFFRTGFVPIVYGCREANGSLKPVPPGKTRESLGYCKICRAPACLFASNRVEQRLKEPPNEAKVRAGRSKAVTRRAKGLNSKGEPLTESCWNCADMRQVLDGGYVCWRRPDDKPVCRWTMETTRKVEKTGCTDFQMRLTTEIPFLDDALGGGE